MPLWSMRLAEPGPADLCACQLDVGFQRPAARVAAVTAEQPRRARAGPLPAVHAQVVATQSPKAKCLGTSPA